MVLPCILFANSKHIYIYNYIVNYNNITAQFTRSASKVEEIVSFEATLIKQSREHGVGLSAGLSANVYLNCNF